MKCNSGPNRHRIQSPAQLKDSEEFCGSMGAVDCRLLLKSPLILHRPQPRAPKETMGAHVPTRMQGSCLRPCSLLLFLCYTTSPQGPCRPVADCDLLQLGLAALLPGSLSTSKGQKPASNLTQS